MKNKKVFTGVLTLGILLGGCTSSEVTPSENNKLLGTTGGAAMGALIGQVIGNDTKGTLIGAGIGALAGLGWGTYKDRQVRELRSKLKDSNVSVVDMGNQINLNIPGEVSFPVNGYVINEGFKSSLNDIASVLKAYPESKIIINGYTDNTGSIQVNNSLSKRRANSVAQYFINRGVASQRISAMGLGPENPVANNSTAAGRAQNRRVEIIILQS